ncbi:MAG: glycosyltransferase family 2 protein [Bacteroidales bacterium]
MSIKISIITVCYNAQACIESTIQSVLGQTYADIEYILIDGNSKDHTLAIIQKYALEAERKKYAYRWISESDKGIYDAMNKGLHLAKGDYVWFINAGDRIYAPETLQKVIDGLYTTIFAMDTKKLPDSIYGDTALIDEQGRDLGLRSKRPPEILDFYSFSKGMLVCHQSILIKREIASDYDLQYKIVADIDWVFKVLKIAKWNYNTHIILSSYLQGGFSKVNEKESWKERFKVMVKNYGYVRTLYYHVKICYNHLCFLEK